MLMHFSKTDFPAFHKKGWGCELWIHNDEKYCGKLLHFDEGKRCSFHYHIRKHETFYLASGLIELLTYDLDRNERQFPMGQQGHDMMKSLVELYIATGVVPRCFDVDELRPGRVFEVPPKLVHMMYAREKSQLYEFSTQHFEDDSYRCMKGD